MPFFFICFIVFIICFRVKMKSSKTPDNTKDALFWEREQKANFARAKDISSLPYLQFNEDDLPFSNSTQDENMHYLEQEVRERGSRKMLNLSAYSNTDLKEQYGVANLEELSNCDQNFLYFIHALNKWGMYLYEQEDYTHAEQVMQYSLSIGSDISTVFTTLAAIYSHNNQLHKIDELIHIVEQSSMPLKEGLIKKLKISKLEN